MHAMDCGCAPILQFSMRRTIWRHRRAQNSEPQFLVNFFTSLRKDSVANYAWIWTLFRRVLEV